MRKIVFLWISIMFLAGCVTLPRGYADAELESSIRERLKDDFKIPVDEARVQAIQVTTDTLVTLDEAVGIALSNNPSILALYAELSIAKASGHSVYVVKPRQWEMIMALCTAWK